MPLLGDYTAESRARGRMLVRHRHYELNRKANNPNILPVGSWLINQSPVTRRTPSHRRSRVAPCADGHYASKMAWDGRWESEDSGVTAPQDKRRRTGPSSSFAGCKPQRVETGTRADIRTPTRRVAHPGEQTPTSGWRRRTRSIHTTGCLSLGLEKGGRPDAGCARAGPRGH